MNYRMVSLLAVLLASSGTMWGAESPSVRFKALKDGEKISTKKVTFRFDKGDIVAYADDFPTGSYTLCDDQMNQLIKHSKKPTIMTMKSKSNGFIKRLDTDKKSFKCALKCKAVYHLLNRATQNNIENIYLLTQNSDIKVWRKADIADCNNEPCLNLGDTVKMNTELVKRLKKIFATDTTTTHIGILTSHGRFCISREAFEARFPLSNDPKKDSPSQQKNSSGNWLSNKWSNASWSQVCVGGVSFAAILAAIYYYYKK